MPLSEDAKKELEKWLDDADRRLWMRQEDRRSARATRNITLLGALLTVVAVFGGPALLDKMTRDAVDETARRVTEQIRAETEKLEERAKTAAIDAELASKSALERSKRAEEISKKAEEISTKAVESAEKATETITQEAATQIVKLATIDEELEEFHRKFEAESNFAIVAAQREVLTVTNRLDKLDEVIDNTNGH